MANGTIMSTAAERAAQLDLVARLKSSFPELPDAPSPDLLDHARIKAYLKPVHDVGGEPENPVPPWKTSLDGLCDALDHASCDADVPTFKERRDSEDVLSATIYADLPYPENQLVSLAHSPLTRGVIDEAELQRRLASVRRRLEA